MTGELRAAVDAMPVEVFAVRIHGGFVFRTFRDVDYAIRVELWHPADFTWELLTTVPLAGWTESFGSVRSQVHPRDRVDAAELVGVRNTDDGVI